MLFESLHRELLTHQISCDCPNRIVCEARERYLATELMQLAAEPDDEFMECAACAAKPGSPILCKSCLHNRTVIDRLRNR